MMMMMCNAGWQISARFIHTFTSLARTWTELTCHMKSRERTDGKLFKGSSCWILKRTSAQIWIHHLHHHHHPHPHSHMSERSSVCVYLCESPVSPCSPGPEPSGGRALPVFPPRLSPSWPSPAPACSAPPSRALRRRRGPFQREEEVRGVLEPFRSGSAVTSQGDRLSACFFFRHYEFSSLSD